MTGPRKVRGIFGAIEAEAGGDNWELEAPSADFMPGMGFGATKQATRWAFIGMCHERIRRLEQLQRMERPAHRPSIDPIQSKDAARAFAAWHMCRDIRALLAAKSRSPASQNRPGKMKRTAKAAFVAKGHGAEAHFTSRELVRLVQAAEDALRLPAHERYFPRAQGSWDASVSRGKRILEIDDNWHSRVCEELLESFSKTT